MIIVRHTVDDGDRTGCRQLFDRIMFDDAGHNNIDESRQDFSGVLNRLMAAQLNHSRSQILSVTTQLLHSRFKGYARSGG